MREHEVPTSVCAQVLGVSPSTVRRMKHPRLPSSHRRLPLDPTRCAHVRSLVRATHGLVGAANLARTAGLPRRNCAEIKRRELREMELERRARCASVLVAAPNIIRGFDAMHVDCIEGRAYWLVAADAAVPYRTSIATVLHYDSASVVAALRNDFEVHGAPLVLRLDRIACALRTSKRCSTTTSSWRSTAHHDTRATTVSWSDRTASIVPGTVSYRRSRCTSSKRLGTGCERP